MEITNKHIVPNEIMLGQVRQMIEEGHIVTIKVKGYSMLPFIVGERDSVTLEKPFDLKKRDIVLAEVSKGHYVLHRIKGLGFDSVTLMGDGNLHSVEHCPHENIIGKVKEIIRKGKIVNPNSKSEQRKVTLWLIFSPLRRILLALYRRM